LQSKKKNHRSQNFTTGLLGGKRKSATERGKKSKGKKRMPAYSGRKNGSDVNSLSQREKSSWKNKGAGGDVDGRGGEKVTKGKERGARGVRPHCRGRRIFLLNPGKRALFE